MPTEQELAPDFTAQDDQGNTISLSNYRAQWLVLYFYPKAMTRGWTIQAQGIRDDFAKYEQAKAVVMGVSHDTVEDQAEFKKQENLPFILIADPEHQIAEQYGVWKERERFGKKFMGIERTTFLVDPDGKIAKIFPAVDPETHSQSVLDALAELQG